MRWSGCIGYRRGRHGDAVARAFLCQSPTTAPDPEAPTHLTGAAVASGDLEHAFHGVRCGCVRTVASEPDAHGPPRQRNGGAGQRPGVGWIDGCGQRIEIVGLVGEEAGLTGEHGDDVTLGDLVEQGHHLVPDAVAPMGGILVRRIPHHRQPEVPAQGDRLGPAQGEDGMTRVLDEYVQSAQPMHVHLREIEARRWGIAKVAACDPAGAGRNDQTAEPRRRFSNIVSAWSSAV